VNAIGAPATEPHRGRAVMRRWFAPLLAFAASAAATWVVSNEVDLSGLRAHAAILPSPDADVRRALSDLAPNTALEPIYRLNGYRPIWVSPQGLTSNGQALLRTLVNARADGLDPRRYQSLVDPRTRDPHQLARLDIALNQSFLRYVADLHRPQPKNAMFYAGADLSPRATLRPAFEALARSDPAAALGQGLRVHPLYRALRQALTQERAQEAAAGKSGSAREKLLLENMDRLRALPADPGPRYLLVDAGSAKLWMIEHGRAVDSMRVVVGKPRLQTPTLGGAIRFMVRQPYWNLPPDLARERARRVLREGMRTLAAERLQILSDWSDNARVLSPTEVDWRAMAAGKAQMRLRQLPGPDNMMGAMKFTLPNPFGIYLHDTPFKYMFSAADRRRSSGCVRVEDAARLATWLFAGDVPPASGAKEERTQLPAPVPVFIVYLTALPTPSGVVFQPDGYRRDAETAATT
jgi:murein L,D-transpeptidase YcbB/YkuD